MKRLLFMIMIPVLICSCISGRINKIDVETIEFGSGGRFSGQYSNYKIYLKNRVIQKDEGEVIRIEAVKLRRLLKAMETCNFFEIDFNRPYHYTYFIEIKGSRTNRVTWGDPTCRPPEEILSLYDELEELIR